MWDETEGNKGSSEIGTCLYQHIKSLPATTTSVILYSDTCSGQNRNKIVAAALRFAVDSIPNNESTDQKFFFNQSTHTWSATQCTRPLKEQKSSQQSTSMRNGNWW